MNVERVTKTAISDLLGIHFNTVTAKIEGETTSEKNMYQVGFTFIEAVLIHKAFFRQYDFEWLFEFEIQKSA